MPQGKKIEENKYRIKQDDGYCTIHEYYPKQTTGFSRLFEKRVLKSEMHLNSSNMPVGLNTKYYSDGSTLSKVSYDDGFKQGLETIYYPSGNIKSEMRYENGCKHGYHNDFYEDGIMKHTKDYNYGTPCGEEMHYYPSGGIMSCGQYHPNGQLAYEVMFIESGVDIKEVHYNEDGNKHGEQTMWRPDGTKSIVYTFDNGEEVSSVKFHNDGKTPFKIIENTGDNRVVHSTFDKDNNLVEKNTLFFDNKHGICISLDNNGNKIEKYFRHGQIIDDKNKIFFEEGNIVETPSVYKNSYTSFQPQ